MRRPELDFLPTLCIPVPQPVPSPFSMISNEIRYNGSDGAHFGKMTSPLDKENRIFFFYTYILFFIFSPHLHQFHDSELQSAKIGSGGGAGGGLVVSSAP